MKRFIVLQVLICSVVWGKVAAQAENWDTYMAKFGNKPGSVMVDMGLIERAPNKLYPYLLITGPRAQKCDTRGLPAADEIDALEDILNATGNFITGVTAKVLTGTFTYDCERLNYYYVKDTIGIRNAIMRLYDRGYQNYSYAINMKYDPAWTTYRTFLYPDEDTREWMADTRRITAMIAAGDSLTTKRDVTFDISFSSDTARAVFITFAKTGGYKVEKVTTASTVTSMPYLLVVSKLAFVKPDIIQAMATELKPELRKHNGVLGTWDVKAVGTNSKQSAVAPIAK